MKIRLALATVALSVVAATAAYAQPKVSVDLSPSTINGPASAFSGILNTDSAVTIDEDSISWAPAAENLVTNTLDDDILSMGGVALTPGTPYKFTFSFDSPVDFANVAVKSAGTVVGQGSTVPEPGSVALLIGTGMGGGLLFMRRRRK
jgi:hypothetical protein